MLSAPHRLTASRAYQYVYRRGRSFSGSCLRIHVTKGGSGTTQFGIVVSNRVSKRATERNLLKRRLRAALRTHISTVAQGYLVVVVTTGRALRQPYAALRDELTTLLRRAHLLTPAT